MTSHPDPQSASSDVPGFGGRVRSRFGLGLELRLGVVAHAAVRAYERIAGDRLPEDLVRVRVRVGVGARVRARANAMARIRARVRARG